MILHSFVYHMCEIVVMAHVWDAFGFLRKTGVTQSKHAYNCPSWQYNFFSRTYSISYCLACENKINVFLLKEITILGQVYFHNMWPFERFMSVLKKYVLNRARPKGSIAKGYVTEKVIIWSTDSRISYLTLIYACFILDRSYITSWTDRRVH
jgi:hypothetical protein